MLDIAGRIWYDIWVERQANEGPQMNTANVKTLKQQLNKISSDSYTAQRVDIPKNYDLYDFASDLVDIDTSEGTKGRGAFRAVFPTICGAWVAKFPWGEEGANQNVDEAKRFALLAPFGLAPKHRLVWIAGVPVMYVEKLTSMDEKQMSNSLEFRTMEFIKSKLGINDWMQTGLTSTGRRVFSDIGH